MPYSTHLTDEQWALLEPVLSAPGKRGPKHVPDLHSVVDARRTVAPSFHDHGGPNGRAQGAERVVAVDVTGLPVGARWSCQPRPTRTAPAS